MDILDELLADYFLESVPANNAAFRLQLDIFLFQNGLDACTKFMDLPRCVQSEICRKATVELRGPVN